MFRKVEKKKVSVTKKIKSMFSSIARINTAAEANAENWVKAQKDKIFLLDNETKEGEVDWTHFEFLLSMPNSYANMDVLKSPLDVLKQFWTNLWPYIEKMTREYEITIMAHNNLIEDNDDTMKTYVKMVEEMKYMEMFIEEKGREEYEEFKAPIKEKLDREYEELVAKRNQEETTN